MQHALRAYDDVVHSIYEAALAPERWQHVIDSMAGLFGASRGQMFTWTRRPSEGGFVFTHNIPPESLAIWDEANRDEDPLVKVGMERGLMLEGLAYNSTDLVPDEEMFRTTYYKRQWEPIDVARVCSGIIFDGTDSLKLPTLISLGRRMSDPYFTDEHVETMRRLLLHLARSLGVMYHLRGSDLRIAANLAALDQLSRGVLVLDAEGKVAVANRLAAKLLSDGMPFVVDQAGKVQLTRHFAESETGFQNDIREALQPLVNDVAKHYTNGLSLRGHDGRHRFVIHTGPLAGANHLSPACKDGSVVVVIYDLDRAASVNPELLESNFGLTAAEARSALQLVLGGSIEEMASRAAVSANTFKTQLQAAFMKTGTHRQLDMLKLLHGLSLRATSL